MSFGTVHTQNNSLVEFLHESSARSYSKIILNNDHQEKFLSVWALYESLTRSYSKIILDNDHKKKVSPQLSPSMSLQLNPIQKWFWTMITRKCFSQVKSLYESSTWSYSKIIFDTDHKKKVFFPGEFLHESSTRSLSKIILDNDYKKNVSPQLNSFMSLWLDCNKKKILDTDHKKNVSL